MDAVEVVIHVDRGSRWLHLTDPVRIVDAWHPHGIHDALHQVERLTRELGYHAAGFLAYEAGARRDSSAARVDDRLPLVWFAFFDERHVREIAEPAGFGSYEIGDLKSSIDSVAFNRAFDRIKTGIASGNTRQVYYTFDLDGSFSGDPRGLFADLVAARRGRYSAFIRTESHSIVSASADLLFSRNGQEVSVRPVRGAVARGRTLAEDEEQARRLTISPEERAEHMTLVDAIRADLERIAETGTVARPELFAVERSPAVWWMTSRLTARSTARLPDIVAALHPSASVTGTPKVPTMRIISELEPRPRGISTGAIGYVAADGAAQFSVATCTALVDCRSHTVTLGVGSRVVSASDPDSEYRRCLLEAPIPGRRPQPFELLETLRWAPDSGFVLLERHLERLARSAQYFDYRCSVAEIRHALECAVAGSDRTLRVRLLVARDGSARVERALFEPRSGPARIALAASPIDPTDVFLFHKTTNRVQYEQAQLAGYDDVMLWNPQGQVTETSIANIVAEVGGRRVTPPIECGLLAGTFREQLLADGVVHVAPITIEQLQNAPRVWLVNSVRGWWPAALAQAGSDSTTAIAATPTSASRTNPTTANRSQR